MSQDASEMRAARRRRTWFASVRRDGEHPSVARIDPDEALMLMWSLARDAWTLGGRDLPTYERSEMPGRILRGVPRR